jgi:hypothetical protein
MKYRGFGGKKASNIKRPDKPLFEVDFSERFVPGWDLVSGLGQRNKQVIERYKRGSNFHPHAQPAGRGGK